MIVVGHGYDTAPFPGETPTVLWGQAGGGFLDGSEVLPQTPAFTHSVAVADANGLDDVFLGNIWGQQLFTPRLLLGSTLSRFTEAPLPRSAGTEALEGSGTVPVASLLRDVTGDGRIDLIAGGGDSGVFLYTGLINVHSIELAASNTVWGSAGLDTVTYAGHAASYSVTRTLQGE